MPQIDANVFVFGNFVANPQLGRDESPALKFRDLMTFAEATLSLQVVLQVGGDGCTLKHPRPSN